MVSNSSTGDAGIDVEKAPRRSSSTKESFPEAKRVEEVISERKGNKWLIVYHNFLNKIK